MVDIPGLGGLPGPYALGSSSGAGTTTGLSYSGGVNYGQSGGQSTGSSFGTSFIPDYSQTPILENIANYAANMAPQVYQWGMGVYNQNQGNINQLIRQGQQYASPQQQAVDIGMAESGVMQAGEAQRQAALSDLQSYGIDPSAGRYAGLDQANRVQMAASAAGAGNQQRMADIQYGNALTNQGIQASLANAQLGYGASNAMTGLLNTGMSLKYPPLGNVSTSQQQSTQQAMNYGRNISVQNQATPQAIGPRPAPSSVQVARGGYISPALSDSHGEEVDDVPAQLNAGEYVIPADIVKWKGKEFFSKLIAQARKARENGYAGGGPIQGGPPRRLNLGGAI
jgi:hypothetical protein